ncbi:uncharacterized protein LOC115244034 isoform X2 [Formica exsecta]|uniref:uncharacterized protein LOC115244033 isoform X2 n=1 Tax=Formica exsecta TaxID=72781 RepID=UPI001143A078|nr:uncharacterized protein LOC115244033 isoform X2 [Formica exsecta]XP_029677258.1 uncharacterized protein LOC115244034 isoform X2 [Formica exsecta]
MKNGDMEKNSFSNYFGELRHKAHEIDEGTDKLAETWKIPHLLVGGYAERTAQTNACLDEMWESLRDTSDKLEKIQSEFKPLLEDMDQLLKESDKIYQDLKEQCDDLDIVLAEYGYHYKEDDNVQEKHCRDDSKDNTNDSILRVEDASELEIEFTPFLTWKCKAKSKENQMFPA